MSTENRRIETIYGCSRCGQDHERLEFQRFIGDPITCDGLVYSWWGTCPLTRDPILLKDPDKPGLEPPEPEVHS